MSDDRLRFAVVGLGAISPAHLAGLTGATDAARLVAVCDTDVAKADQVAAEWGVRPLYALDAVLADPDIDALDMALPHDQHFAAASRALSAGRHVLMEKPLAPTADECRELGALAEAHGVTLGVAENTPFVDGYIAARRMVEDGVLGAPRLLRTLISGSSFRKFSNTGHWKTTAAHGIGGTIFDAAPHSIFLLRWLFGDIAHVHAVTNRLIASSEVEDHALVTGQLACGAVFSTEYTFTAEVPWSERLEIYGSEASLFVDQLNDPPMTLFRGPGQLRGEPVAAVAFDSAGWKHRSIANGAAAFARAVRDRRPPPVDAAEAGRIMHVVERAYQSVREGGTRVAV